MKKNDIKLYLAGFIILLLSFVICISMSRYRYIPDVEKTCDTVYSTKLHVVVDTHTVYMPSPYLVFLRGDSILVAPGVQAAVEVKEYKDSTFYAKISGVQPSLDEIKVFPKKIIEYRETIVTNNTTRLLKDNRRWGVGISAGYGFSKDGPSPYIGVSINYNIFRF